MALLHAGAKFDKGVMVKCTIRRSPPGSDYFSAASPRGTPGSWMTAALGLAQSTVSEHLACLRGCRLISSRPEGRASVYFLTQPALLAVLEAAEALLDATGDAVALCPNYQEQR